jgi:hypothetical protein
MPLIVIKIKILPMHQQSLQLCHGKSIYLEFQAWKKLKSETAMLYWVITKEKILTTYHSSYYVLCIVFPYIEW